MAEALLLLLISFTCFLSQKMRVYEGKTYMCIASHSVDLSDRLELNNGTFTLTKIYADQIIGVESSIAYTGTWHKQDGYIYLKNLTEKQKRCFINIHALRSNNMSQKKAESHCDRATEKIQIDDKQLKYKIAGDTLIKVLVNPGIPLDLIIKKHSPDHDEP